MARETLAGRIAMLRPFIDSTRYALTEDDVRHDYLTGRNRYASSEATDETCCYSCNCVSRCRHEGSS